MVRPLDTWHYPLDIHDIDHGGGEPTYARCFLASAGQDLIDQENLLRRL